VHVAAATFTSFPAHLTVREVAATVDVLRSVVHPHMSRKAPHEQEEARSQQEDHTDATDALTTIDRTT